MDSSRWDRYGALGGVVFVVLNVLVTVMGGEPPGTRSSVAETSASFAAHAAGLAAVSLLGLAVAGALSFSASAVWAAMALRIDEIGDAAPTFNMLGWMLRAASGFGLAAHLLATNVLAARTRTLLGWLVVCGLLSAVAFLVSGIFGATSDGDGSDLAGLVGVALYCVWVLGVSHRMWREDGSSDVARTGMARPVAP